MSGIAAAPEAFKGTPIAGPLGPLIRTCSNGQVKSVVRRREGREQGRGRREERRAERPRPAAPVKSSARGPAPGCRLVAGLHAVRTALSEAPEQVQRLWIQKGSRVATQLLEDLGISGIAVHELLDEQMNGTLGTHSHQGIGAEVIDSLACSLEELLLRLPPAGERSLLVMLDGIEDPQNLGALFRASECLGSSGIILSRNRGASLTATVAKAAVGATELLPRVEAANLVRAAEQLKAEGFWLVAASLQEDSQPLHEFSFPDRTVLVLGAEGRGVQPLLEKNCDFRVTIPQLGTVQSLNVSQALSVLLYEWERQGLRPRTASR